MTVHVLVVAYGDAARLDTCLSPLRGVYPVLVVDNSRSDSTKEAAARNGATYVDAGENLGFAAAVNLGVMRLPLSDTDVLLLNPDATIEPQEVEKLRTCLNRSARVACAAPRQHPSSSARLAPVRWPFPRPATAWAEAVGLGRFLRGWGYVIASVLLVNGKALQELGGFDEGFFLYAEEADWERRATKNGWAISYCEEAEATHEGAATDADHVRREIRFHSGVERYVRKWHGALGWRSYQLATVLTALRRAVVSGGHRRASSLRLARLYSRGPHQTARDCAVVPTRRHFAPSLAPTADPTSRVAPRVLLVDSIGYEELGGASTVLDEIIRRVDRSRIVPVLACLSRGRWPDQVRAAGTSAYSFPRTRLRSPANLLEVVFGLRKVIRTEQISLVHASENTALPYAALAGALTRTPVVWHIHSPLQARSREERIVAWVLRRLRPTHVVFTSSGARERTMPLAGKRATAIPSTVINPGVDLDRCRDGDRARGRRAIGVPEDALMISMFARFDPMKAQSDFVECLGRLIDRHPDLYGAMCGPGDRKGDYWRGLERLSREVHTEERLIMPGDVRYPLKDDLVAASDVVVHTSHAESFGLAVLEAMAAGKPVVAADTDGPHLLIESGVTGLLVPVADVDALSAAIGRLLEDSDSRQMIGRAAALEAERHPVSEMVRRFEDLWSHVLGYVADPRESPPVNV